MSADDTARTDGPTVPHRITMSEVREWVAAIEAGRHDDENAHSNEDSLWASVLRHIADGGPDGAALAAEALRTTGIEFARWCA